MESRLRKYKRKQQPRKRPGFKSPLNPPNFLVSSGLDLVIYCANVWNEREADNVRERRDFEEDEVKSHLGLSSAQPFKCSPCVCVCFGGCRAFEIGLLGYALDNHVVCSC